MQIPHMGYRKDFEDALGEHVDCHFGLRLSLQGTDVNGNWLARHSVNHYRDFLHDDSLRNAGLVNVQSSKDATC